jgi:nicotinate-nucleotide adenylyltransferase
VRIGIFGGSFDPPHVGHLVLAQDAIEALALDRLQVVPAASQPLKRGHGTSAVHRLAMVRHCFAGVPCAEVDPIEIDRGGLSFMVDTVEHYRGLWPSATLHLLIGDDSAATLPQWREPARLLSMVELVVLHRPVTVVGAPCTTDGRQDGSGGAPAGAVSARPHGARLLETRRMDVSSTEIRGRVRDGRGIRGFVPDAVAAYIASTALYLEPSAEELPARA